MTKTTVHLVRHGEVYNPTGILYGRLPGFNLSDTGRHQAEQVAEWFEGHDLTYVVASPLDRAQQTAAPLAKKFDLQVHTDQQLIEADNAFEGLKVSVGDGALRQPRHWWKLRNPFRPSWGEPYQQLANRMLESVERARQQAEGHEAALVSHQLPVWIARLKLENKRLWHDPRKRQCSLASVTSLYFDGSELRGIGYAEPGGVSDTRLRGA